MLSCFASCTYDDTPVSAWTQKKFCEFYKRSPACPASSVAKYHDPARPTCPPACVRTSCQIAATYCYVYAYLSLGCNPTFHYSLSNVTDVVNSCILAYSAKAKTVTTVNFDASIGIDGVSYTSLTNNTDAQKALVDATANSLGGSPTVTIDSIRPKNSSIILQDVFIGGVAVTFHIQQVAEKMGYPASSASQVAVVLLNTLQKSVSTGYYTQQLQNSAATTSATVLSTAVVQSNITATPATIRYVVTPSPSRTPSLTPTASPSAVQTEPSPVSKPSTTQVAAYIAIGTSMGLLCCGAIALYLIFISRHQEHQNINIKKLIGKQSITKKLMDLSSDRRVTDCSKDAIVDELDDVIDLKIISESSKPSSVETLHPRNDKRYPCKLRDRQMDCILRTENINFGYEDNDLWCSDSWNDPERPTVLSIGAYL